MNRDEADKKLGALGETPDLNVLEQTADQLEKAVRTGDPEGYASFMVDLCDWLNSRDLGDWPQQDRLVRKYGELGLRNATALPSGIQLRLLEHLSATAPDPAADPAMWRIARHAAASGWLRALARLERELDPGFDQSDVPLVNVSVPGNGLPAGAAAEYVQDPALRRRYAREVARNHEHAARYVRQVELRRLLERFRPVAQRYLVASYARAGGDADELRQLLAENVLGTAWREAVLSDLDSAVRHGGAR